MRNRKRVLLQMVIGFSILIIPHLAFRFYYYGYPLPNTFYAKVEPDMQTLRRGLLYVGDFFLCHGPWALPVLIGLIRFPNEREEKRLLLIVFTTLLAAFVYTAIVGGDFYELWRFCAPYAPWHFLLICAGAYSIGIQLRLKQRWAKSPSSIGVAATLVIALSIIVPAKIWPFVTDRFKKEEWEFSNNSLKQLGLWLKDSYPDSTLIAITWLGRVPYYSGFKTVDMLGITDVKIARTNSPKPIIVTPLGKAYDISSRTNIAGHGKFDPSYVLSRKPDLVIVEFPFNQLGNSFLIENLHTKFVFEKIARNAVGPALPGLLARTDFRRAYVPRIAKVSHETMFIYFERDHKLAILEQEAKAYPEDPRKLFALAVQYRKQGLLLDAIAGLERAEKLNAGHYGIRLNKGYFLMESEQFLQAREVFRKLSSDFPEQSSALYGLALAYYKINDHAAAIALWEKLLARFPNHSKRTTIIALLENARKKLK